jgi:hypothetical protein
VISHQDQEANALILREDLLKAGQECQLFRILVLLWNEVANRHVAKNIN